MYGSAGGLTTAGAATFNLENFTTAEQPVDSDLGCHAASVDSDSGDRARFRRIPRIAA